MVNYHAHEGVETISNPSESARQAPTQVLNSPSLGKPQCSPHYEDDDDGGHGTFQGSPIFHLGGNSLGFGIAGRWFLEWLALNFNLIHKLLHCLGTIPDHGLPPIACISSCISTYNSLRIWRTIHLNCCMYFNMCISARNSSHSWRTIHLSPYCMAWIIAQCHLCSQGFCLVHQTGHEGVSS